MTEVSHLETCSSETCSSCRSPHLILALPGLAAARGPSTPAERKKAVETTRRLERSPLAPNADADRKWLLKWIVESRTST